jgi:hypothetical protein
MFDTLRLRDSSPKSANDEFNPHFLTDLEEERKEIANFNGN